MFDPPQWCRRNRGNITTRTEKMARDVFPAAVREQDSAQYVVGTGPKRLLS
jgi:hypothetical protein